MRKISIDEFQDFVETTWIPSEDTVTEELRILSGLMSELGEIAEKIKKYYHDGGDAQKFREDIQLELFDVIYYWAKMHNFYDLDAMLTLVKGVDKLNSRKERGVIKGSGDKR